MQGLIRTWNSAENKNFVFMFPAVGLLGNCCINSAELCSTGRLVVKVRLAIFIFTPIHLLSIFSFFYG